MNKDFQNFPKLNCVKGKFFENSIIHKLSLAGVTRGHTQNLGLKGFLSDTNKKPNRQARYMQITLLLNPDFVL